MSSRFIVYGLVDPQANALRYVGKSSYGMTRPRAHEKDARKGERGHKASWIRQLLALGITYNIIVLEELPNKDGLSERERWWIAFARSWGCKLTNLTDGGEGIPGCILTKETKERMRASWALPVVRERHREAMARPETKALRSASLSAAMARPEVRARHSAACARPETKKRKRAAANAAWERPEVRVKHSAAVRAASISSWSRPETQARHSSASRAAQARPDVKIRHRVAILEAMARPETKNRRSAASIAVWARPGEHERRSAAAKAAQARPEVKALVRAASRAAWARPEYREKRRLALARLEVKAKRCANRARKADIQAILTNWGCAL